MLRLRYGGQTDGGQGATAALTRGTYAVGWAKAQSAVPTNLSSNMILKGGHASLCPPYETILDLPHHAGLARQTFQRVAIPLRRNSCGLIGALQEIEQRCVGIVGRAHGV